MSLLVLGSVNTDLVIQSAQLPSPGETVLGGQFYRAAGGKGANQAVAAARASLTPVTFIAAVGEDTFGAESLQALASENLETRWIKTVTGVASGVALILVNETGENLISVASGANAELLPEDVMRIPEEVFQESSVFLTNLESPLSTVKIALMRAKLAGAMTILNPAPVTPGIKWRELFQHVDLVTPNEHELASMTLRACQSAVACENSAGLIKELTGPQVLVTRGAKGSIYVGQSPIQHIPAMRVDAVDATGAGDCFNGVLAVGLAEGLPMGDAIQRASVAASLSVTVRGAQPSLPTRSAIDTALSEFEG